jgi:hypothetical protein
MKMALEARGAAAISSIKASPRRPTIRTSLLRLWLARAWLLKLPGRIE